MTHDERFDMTHAMAVYGGSFVRALAVCFLTADGTNLQKLEQTFPKEVAQYQDMGKILKEREHVDN